MCTIFQILKKNFLRNIIKYLKNGLTLSLLRLSQFREG